MGHTSQSTLCECVGVFIPWHRSFRMRRPESWLCLWLDTFDMASSQSNRDRVCISTFSAARGSLLTLTLVLPEPEADKTDGVVQLVPLILEGFRVAD